MLYEKRLDMSRFPSVLSSMPVCGSSSRLPAQLSRALGWPSAQIGIAGGSRVASVSSPNSWRPGFASTSTPLRDGMLWKAAAGWLEVPCRAYVRVSVCACVSVRV